MKIKVRHSRNSHVLLLFLCCGFLGVVNQQTVFGQDGEAKASQEAAVIKNVEAAGGRVMQISAADPTREVSFYLAGENIADEQLKGIEAIQNVIWLNLANTKVTDDGLKQIAGMKLQKLHLENTGIGDAGLAHLKDMLDLEYLNLYATSVTNDGLKHLAKMSKLKKLYVWQSKVTEEGMKSLEEQIPGLKVIGECKLPVIEEPTKEEPKAEEAKKEEPKAEEAKKEDPKKEDPKTDAEKKSN